MAAITRPDRRGATDPQDLPVQLNIKVPWHYREQLMKMAMDERVSMTRFVLNALIAKYPPERQ